jgi:hypothetical protein
MRGGHEVASTLDLDAAAAFLKISPKTCQELAHSGELPGCKVGIAWVFLEEQLVRYLVELTEVQQRIRRETSGVEAITQNGESTKKARRARRPRDEPRPDLAKYNNSPESMGKGTTP